MLLLPLLSASPPCSQYGPCKRFDFVPAQPGQTPTCAKPGSTFCESVEHYPKQLIRYLIEKWGYDYNTLLSDEARDQFSDRVEYGPLPNHVYSHLHVPLIQAAVSYGPITTNVTQLLPGGYPDRRYNIDPHLLTNALQPPSYPEEGNYVHKGGGFVYSTTVVDPPSPNPWWPRAKRSGRKKRQAAPPLNGGSTTLCPTTSNFVMPRAAVNTRGNWMFTVNLNEVDDRYTQLVRSETCVSRECNGLCSLPTGYTSRCEQQYVQKRLVALEGTGERLYSDVFWFPHCCVCQITPPN